MVQRTLREQSEGCITRKKRSDGYNYRTDAPLRVELDQNRASSPQCRIEVEADWTGVPPSLDVTVAKGKFESLRVIDRRLQVTFCYLATHGRLCWP